MAPVSKGARVTETLARAREDARQRITNLADTEARTARRLEKRIAEVPDGINVDVSRRAVGQHDANALALRELVQSGDAVRALEGASGRGWIVEFVAGSGGPYPHAVVITVNGSRNNERRYRNQGRDLATTIVGAVLYAESQEEKREFRPDRLPG